MMRLYVVYSHPMVEASLRMTLEHDPDTEVVGSQQDADRAEERVLQSQASALLLDGSIGAARLIQIISRVSPVVKVVVLVEQDEPDLMVRCILAGASGYVSGSRGVGEIASALRRAHDGWAILTVEQVTTLIVQARGHSLDDHAIRLSTSLGRREREVLRSIAAGDSLAEAAARLGISTHTVQTHLKNVMRKLRTRTRLAAVVMALRAGILDEDNP
jgi:DNA-binding NarL/FixJ family response regulator